MRILSQCLLTASIQASHNLPIKTIQIGIVSQCLLTASMQDFLKRAEQKPQARDAVVCAHKEQAVEPKYRKGGPPKPSKNAHSFVLGEQH